MTFTEAEIEYLSEQPLGRLATVGPHGGPQNNPVSFSYEPETGALLVGGHRMGATQKFRNARARPLVSLVVDDIVSFRPWVVRCLEIRGTAQAFEDHEPPMQGFSREVIRITPTRILGFGINADAEGMIARDVPDQPVGIPIQDPIR
ncbi:MAG: PPOX class F420-dependent oxidoreductase [Geodermatophilaceae bacterium]|nr:PPOX class F420-dependent oxidoreductase [Geodermatophilaceae bacterium]